MMNRLKHLMVGSTLLLFAAACADLDVTNPNAPDAGRALQTAGDVESLVSGSFSTWHVGNSSSGSAGPFLSNASFQHTAPWANFCMEEYARIPRIPIVNQTSHGCYGNLSSPWTNSYRALASVADGLRVLANDQELADELGAEETLRAQAFGAFVQGLSHATIAILYNHGWIVDEDTEQVEEGGALVLNPGDPVEPSVMMDAALGYFDRAIELAGQDMPAIDANWMNMDASLSAEEFQQLAYSLKARYRASLPRTPADPVDWQAVISDVENGITEDFVYNAFNRDGLFRGVVYYGQVSGWAEVPYFIWGMADPGPDNGGTDNYDTWLSLSLGDKHPIANEESLLLVSPDQRFPQGTTLEDQQENSGTVIGSPANIVSVWAQPGRGTWRWSYYKIIRDDAYWAAGANAPLSLIEVEELRLLEAEARLNLDQPDIAADLINETRVAAGLNETDATGTNTSCVPRLPDGSCGGLFEMLKWEKRLETATRGPLDVAMYFDSRRWGDLYRGTYLQFPAPCLDMELFGLPCETFGGVGGDMASAGSNYAWPTEG